GPPQAAAALKETLWMGAEEGILLSDRKFGGADVAATSSALALGIGKFGRYDLILCGKQTTDGDTAQVGPELAERLGIEHAANVTRIVSVEDGFITVDIDLDTAVERLKIALPCLLTVDKDVNTPRLPSFVRKKEIEGRENIRILSVADFPEADETKLGLKGSPTQVERIFPPEKNVDKEVLKGSPEELSSKLFGILQDRKFV
ncbi:MAG: electron transfer flavoprotein subunit beta/FixA family protein, partial [Clostridia bacterium]|nr:electron transfer flavoprotein subunit beta/FixA family protein [Clostridia bacterium]